MLNRTFLSQEEKVTSGHKDSLRSLCPDTIGDLILKPMVIHNFLSAFKGKHKTKLPIIWRANQRYEYIVISSFIVYRLVSRLVYSVAGYKLKTILCFKLAASANCNALVHP